MTKPVGMGGKSVLKQLDKMLKNMKSVFTVMAVFNEMRSKAEVRISEAVRIFVNKTIWVEERVANFTNKNPKCSFPFQVVNYEQYSTCCGCLHLRLQCTVFYCN